MRYFITLVVAIFFSACFGINKEKVLDSSSFKYPSWYINPPLNNQTKLYGVSQGKTKEEAILNALDDLSSRLMLTIESNQEVSSKSFRDFREYISKTTTQKIKTNTEKLSFKDYKIEDFYSSSNEIFYLISVKKSDLITTLNSEISNLYEEFRFINMSNDDILAKNLKYKELLLKFYKNLNKAQILEGLEEKESQKRSENIYINTIQKIEKEIKNNISEISFFINSDTDSKIFESNFKDALNKKSYKVVSNKQSINSYEVNLSSKQSKLSPSGFFIVENILNVKIKDSKNSQILSKTIELKGASSNNFEDAKINLIQKLRKYEELGNILPFD